MKSYGDRLKENFEGKNIPKENASYKCLSWIALDSVIRVNKKYYHQTLLEERKYTIKKNNDDLHSSSHDKSYNRSGNGFGNSSYIESNNYVAVI